jgi:hypothetical protein
MIGQAVEGQTAFPIFDAPLPFRLPLLTATRGETAVRYRTAVVVPSSLFELILVSGVPSTGRATGAGRS